MWTLDRTKYLKLVTNQTFFMHNTWEKYSIFLAVIQNKLIVGQDIWNCEGQREDFRAQEGQV